MRMHVLLIAAICSLFWAAPGRADTPSISGSDAPDYLAAVESWLEGNDLAALNALASLSRDGNAAAQILLSGIASRAPFHSHVTSTLTRADRIALLRAPGGLSGKSWLTVAEATEPLATALLQITRIGERIDPFPVLMKLGEPQDAELAVDTMIMEGEINALIEMFQGIESEFPIVAEALLYLTILSQVNESSGTFVGLADIEKRLNPDPRFESSSMAWEVPRPRDILLDTERRKAAIRLSDQVPSWTPVKRFCARQCASGLRTCTVLGGSLLSRVGRFPLRSPRMSLISNERYWDSPRIEADLARSFVDFDRYSADVFDPFDTCFMDAMSAARADHSDRR